MSNEAERESFEPSLRVSVVGILCRWQKDDEYDIDTCIRDLRAILAASLPREPAEKRVVPECVCGQCTAFIYCNQTERLASAVQRPVGGGRE